MTTINQNQMNNTLSNISELSLIDNIVYSDFTQLESLEYSDKPIGSGGFGTVYETLNPLYVVKILNEETARDHAYDTIKLLYSKIKSYPLEQGAFILQDFPELIGLPFAVFKAYDSIKQDVVTVLLMHNLIKNGFIDLGGESSQTIRIKQLKPEDKFILCYQLTKVIDFLHNIKFIHSDLSDNSIWINPDKNQIALIDYDSGYHYDKQSNPNTIGKISQWLDGTFKKLFSFANQKSPVEKSKSLTVKDRLDSEYWILANAIFELIFNTNPYFFLIDADHQTKIDYSNSYHWPNIDTTSHLFQKQNEKAYNKINQNLQSFIEFGLESLVNSFSKVFGKGYNLPEVRLSANEWKEILYKICVHVDKSYPSITIFESNKTNIYSNKEEVLFKWNGERYNKSYLNGKLVPYNKNQLFMTFPDSQKVTLVLVNDFREDIEEIYINAVKVDPEILVFKANKYVRDDMAPIVLDWNTKNVDHVFISSSNNKLLPLDSVNVEPTDLTIYTLTVVGHFGQKVIKELSLDVIYPKILEFSFEVNLHKGLNNVDIKWVTEYAEKVILVPLAGERVANGLEHISISGELQFTLTAIGHFKSVKKELIAEPFGVPKIRQIETPMPNFQITNIINTENLKAPNFLIKLSEIKFVNQIVINNTEFNDNKIFDKLKKIDFSTSDEIDISSFNTNSNIIKRSITFVKNIIQKISSKSITLKNN